MSPVKKTKAPKKAEVLEKTFAQKQQDKEVAPYMNKGIYHNYEKVMKEKNQKRKGQGLEAIHIRTFEEWSNG